MEEDEITNSVEEQVSMVEPKDEEDAKVSEQCGTVLIAGVSSEKITEEVVAAVVERGEDAVENVEKAKFGGAVMEELTVAPDDCVIMEVKEEERNEGENVEVSKSEGAEVVDDGVKVEEVEMEMEREKEKKRRDEEGIVEELRLDVDKVEVAGERRDGLGSIDGDDEVKTEELEMKIEEVIEKSNLGNENGGQESREGEVIVNADEGLGVGEQAEKKEQLVEKGEVMPGEESTMRTEKEEEMVGEEDMEGRGEELEDSEATGDGEVTSTSPVVAEEEETHVADTEMETESQVVKSGSGSGGKRRRGRIPKASTPVKAPARKTVGEDVCFICLDGGDLVLCDRRGCPKAYHPSCVDHDDEFFKTKGRWNCGWHLCNQCGKNAYFYCYTCTFSVCKGCSKNAVTFCVRGSKGFCESCMKTVTMIESNEPNAMGQASFDDKSSWEYLFKDYWIEQKEKLSISSDELAQAKNPLRDSGITDRQRTPAELFEATNDAGTDSDSSLANVGINDSKRKRVKRKSKPVDSDTDGSSEKEVSPARRKNKRRSKSRAKEASSDSEHSSGKQGSSSKRGKKARRLSKSSSKTGIEWASAQLMEFVMHMNNGDRSVLTRFDVQSLLLEYISRNKLRDPRRQSQILCDSMLQKLFGKPRVGHFEMLELLESHFLLKDSHVDNNQGSIVDTEISQLDADDHTDLFLDCGKSRGRKSRKRGEERGQSNLDDYAAIDMHNINLIYLRRCLMESLMDDSEMFHDKVVGSFVRIRIPGSSQKQDIYRLVQIIGTSKAPEPYKVGKRTTDVMLEILNLDKTEIIAIDSISNQEFSEDECKRLRQSIKCGLISRLTVGDVLEKARELQGVRVSDWLEAEIVRLGHLRDRASEKGRKKELRECVEKLQLLKTPEERQRRLDQIPEVHADPKMDPHWESDDENELHDKSQANNMRPRESEFVRRGREHFSSRHGGTVSNDSWSGNARPPNKTCELGRNSSDKGFSSRRDDNTTPSKINEHTWGNGVEKGTPSSNSWEKPRVIQDTSVSIRAEQSVTRSDLSMAVPLESSQPLSSSVGQTDGKTNEAEKVWHYTDPTGKVQGPFSMAQLRKWSNTGYFPAELRIWKTSQTEDDSILLTSALAGRFQKESHSVGSTPSSMDTSKLTGGRYDSSSLPSPTPSRSPATLSGKQTSDSFQSNLFQRNERLPSPTPTSPSKFSHQLKGDVVGNKHENVTSSTGASKPGSVHFVSNSKPINVQQMSSQSVAHVTNQSFIPPDSTINRKNVGPNNSVTGQGFSNMVQPGTGQNPAVYSQNWGPGFIARPDMVNADPTSNNALPVQVAYNQWTGAQVNNQGSQFAAGYPPGQGNVAANFPGMSVNNAWRPPAQTNMPWGAQQQPVNQNVGWAGQPAGAMSQSSSGTPAGAATVGWTGTGPSPSAGNTDMVWVGAPGSMGTWGGDQNRNGGSDQNRNTGGGQNRNGGSGQYNRQSSFSRGGQRVCKYFREYGNCRKGSSCDYMHT